METADVLEEELDLRSREPGMAGRRGERTLAKMVGGLGGMKDGERRGILNTAIYSPRVSASLHSVSTLDFAVRICGMSVAGTRPSGFLIAKRIRRDRRAADRRRANPLSGP